EPDLDRLRHGIAARRGRIAPEDGRLADVVRVAVGVQVDETEDLVVRARAGAGDEPSAARSIADDAVRARHQDAAGVAARAPIEPARSLADIVRVPVAVPVAEPEDAVLARVGDHDLAVQSAADADVQLEGHLAQRV